MASRQQQVAAQMPAPQPIAQAFVTARADAKQLVIEAWRASGRSMAATERATGLPWRIVRMYLEMAREDWKRDVLDGYQEHVDAELQVLARLDAECLEAWAVYKAGGKIAQPFKYLEILAGNSDRRRDLLGLDKPKVLEVDLVSFVGDPDWTQRHGEKMSEAQAAELLSQKALLGREALEVAKQICGVVEREGDAADDLA